MSSALTEICIDERSSCTVDEAVAKMLGWIRGSRRSKYCLVTELGIPLTQMETLHKLEMSPEQYLAELRESASREFADAVIKFGDIVDSGNADEIETTLQVCERNEAEIVAIDKLIQTASLYRAEIIDELANNETSALRKVPDAAEDKGVIHITLASLNRWTTGRFQIQIHPNFELLSPRATKSVVTDKPKAPPKHRAQELIILETIRRLGYRPLQLPPNRPGMAGVRSQIRDELQKHPLFSGSTIFNKAWERLQGFGDIAYTQ